MNKLIFVLSFLYYSSFGQSYLGQISKKVNFREGPGTEYPIIASLKVGQQIFIISKDIDSDYYNVIDISTNKEGYVHKLYIKIGREIKKNDQSVFTPNGQVTNYNPELEIFNNTHLILTLKLNGDLHTFNPKEKKSISIPPGLYNYRASAPRVIPNFGEEKFQSNQGYSWQFYIVNR